MHDIENLGPRIIIWFDSGPLKGLYITETVFWAIIVAVGVTVFALLISRRLERDPKGAQGIAELIVEYAYKIVGSTMGKRNLSFAPFIGTLFLFLLFANALGLLGFRPVTSDLNATFALAALVFILIQYNSIRSRGMKGYLHHFCEPYAIMIPIKILEEFTFPISLSFRLFGNILAGVIIMALVFTGLGYLSEGILHLPIPLLEGGFPLPLNAFFDIFEPILQSFVFSMLTMTFIAKAIASHDDH
ncbi:MAG: F0F1 ATP synthase subunit A [Clostridiales Family XIII bacterium]|jgi:F-type H+-transporting ATPase subunit a|nr:F0F1 ATP synthase subunit A [Clostridiales Family XIII bacterium]